MKPLLQSAGPSPLTLLKLIRRVLTVAAVLASGVWVTGCSAVWAVQDGIIFPAPTTPLGDPAARGMPAFHTEHLVTADGLRLAFWAIPPRPGMPTIIDFHGNASSALGGAVTLLPLAQAGYGAVAAEFRGYSGNPGTPSEAGLIEDARAYAAWAAAHGAERPVLLGESIGTGVAVALGAEHPVMGVILDSPYTSIADVMATGPFHWLPVSLLRHRFDNLARIRRVVAPVLVIHGLADTVIPPDQGRRLFAAAPCPWQALFLPGVQHQAIANDTSGAAQQTILRFLQSLRSDGSCPVRRAVEKVDNGLACDDQPHPGQRRAVQPLPVEEPAYGRDDDDADAMPGAVQRPT